MLLTCNLRCGTGFSGLIFKLRFEILDLPLGLIVVEMDLSKRLLVTFQALMQLLEAIVDLIDIGHKVHVQTCILDGLSHQRLVVFDDFLRELIQIESNLLKIELDLVVTMLNLEDVLLQVGE